VIDQTIPLDQLTGGMARCVREWILPKLVDPFARLQAEQLAALLESLSRAWSPAAAESIRADSDEAREALERAGEAATPAGHAGSIEDLMRENAELKSQLLALADRLREGREPRAEQRLKELRGFFLESLRREFASTSAEGFESLTARDRDAQKG
jgi:hypothetical protein